MEIGRVLNYSLLLDFWKLQIFVKSNSVHSLEKLAWENPRFVKEQSSETPMLTIDHIAYKSKDELPLLLRPKATECDPKLLIDPQTGNLLLIVSNENAEDALRALVIRIIVQHYSQRGFSFFHGSVVERNGRAVAFVGEKGSGKTSFLLDLIYNRGWKYLADDLMMVGSDDDHALVHGLQSSVNIDIDSSDPEEYVAITKKATSSVTQWLLPHTAKRRCVIPENLTSEVGQLAYIVFPTIHPLASMPTVEAISRAEILHLLNINRYKAPTIPGLRLPDQGRLDKNNMTCALENVSGLLFLGNMNLTANSELIRLHIL